MPIRNPKPTSPGRRFVTYPDFAEVTRSEPEKSLTEGLKKSGGRNSRGRKTSRHRGGGEGSTTPGRNPVTPWGVPTLGYRTRKKGKTSDRYIVRGRRRGKKR